MYFTGNNFINYSKNNSGKLAFLFMIYDKLDWFQIWNKFFYNINTNFYKVIIHRSNPSDKINNLSFPYEIIDTVDSSWCFLVGVKKLLLIKL